MTNETQKLELIQWISQLDDSATLQKLYDLKKNKNVTHKKRTFGCGKDIILYISPDFNDPLPEFDEYAP
jgi:hypothetical protein